MKLGTLIFVGLNQFRGNQVTAATAREKTVAMCRGLFNVVSDKPASTTHNGAFSRFVGGVWALGTGEEDATLNGVIRDVFKRQATKGPFDRPSNFVGFVSAITYPKMLRNPFVDSDT